jgi:hypothetical protein
VVDSPVFTVDRGYSGNAAGYLDTGFNPATHGAASQNDAHIGVWPVQNTAVAAADCGNAASRLNARDSSNQIVTFLNAGSSDLIGSVTESRGHLAASRSNSSNYIVYRNGTALTTHTRASVAPSNATFHICARNGFAANNDRQIAAMHCGPALSGAEIGDLYAILGAYLSVLGAV